MFKDYYQILGISPSASKKDIKDAYRTKSLQWHPDRNPNVDVTGIMQDINEAYKILNDDISRTRYDKEYQIFIQQRLNRQPNQQNTKSGLWNYDYEVNDENLKNDINEARSYAKHLVDEFFKNLKETTKVAAKGGWEGAKGYLYAAIILTIMGLCIRTCMGIHKNNEYSHESRQIESSLTTSSIVGGEPVLAIEEFHVPDSLMKYYFAHQAFSLFVPPIVELRHDYDKYVKRLHKLGLSCNTEDVVFQQRNLANNSSEALSRYCRIIIQHHKGSVDDFPLASETFPMDPDVRTELREMVENELEPFKLIGEPLYKWISIEGTKAIEISYRRTGADKYTTACKIYLLFNGNEMVKIIVSYREQESDIWLPDLTNIIKTFTWGHVN
jgi:hypothetical protein